MIDRLSEIKARPAVIRTVVDVEWLIAEVERLKAIIEEHRLMYCKDVGNLQAEVERLKEKLNKAWQEVFRVERGSK